MDPELRQYAGVLYPKDIHLETLVDLVIKTAQVQAYDQEVKELARDHLTALERDPQIIAEHRDAIAYFIEHPQARRVILGLPELESENIETLTKDENDVVSPQTTRARFPDAVPAEFENNGLQPKGQQPLEVFLRTFDKIHTRLKSLQQTAQALSAIHDAASPEVIRTTTKYAVSEARSITDTLQLFEKDEYETRLEICGTVVKNPELKGVMVQNAKDAGKSFLLSGAAGLVTAGMAILAIPELYAVALFPGTYSLMSGLGAASATVTTPFEYVGLMRRQGKYLFEKTERKSVVITNKRTGEIAAIEHEINLWHAQNEMRANGVRFNRPGPWKLTKRFETRYVEAQTNSPYPIEEIMAILEGTKRSPPIPEPMRQAFLERNKKRVENWRAHKREIEGDIAPQLENEIVAEYLGGQKRETRLGIFLTHPKPKNRNLGVSMYENERNLALSYFAREFFIVDQHADDINMQLDVACAFEDSLKQIIMYAAVAEWAEYIKEKHLYPTVFPTISDATSIDELVHPILATQTPAAVGSDYHDVDGKTLLVTGPNGNGKSVYIEAAALSYAMAQAGWPVVATKASIKPIDQVLTHTIKPGDIALGESRSMSEASRVRTIIDRVTDNSVVILDETYTGTEPNAGSQALRDLIDVLHVVGATVLVTTHYHDLIPWIERQEGMKNMHAVVADNGERRYRILPGGSRITNFDRVLQERGVDSQSIRKRLQERIEAKDLTITDGLRAYLKQDN